MNLSKFKDKRVHYRNSGGGGSGGLGGGGGRKGENKQDRALNQSDSLYGEAGADLG